MRRRRRAHSCVSRGVRYALSTIFHSTFGVYFVKVKQSRYFPGCMGPNPLLHVIQTCAGGRSKGEIFAFVDPHPSTSIFSIGADAVTTRSSLTLDRHTCADDKRFILDATPTSMRAKLERQNSKFSRSWLQINIIDKLTCNSKHCWRA